MRMQVAIPLSTGAESEPRSRWPCNVTIGRAAALRLDEAGEPGATKRRRRHAVLRLQVVEFQ
jgi:hypothetical protein